MLKAPIRKPRAPALPIPDRDYSQPKWNQVLNALRIYFTQMDRAVGQLADANDGYNSYLSETAVHVVMGTSTHHAIATSSYTPIVSVRLAADSLTSVVVPVLCAATTDTNDTFQIALIKNATLTGAAYDTTTYDHVDFDIDASSMSGGEVITSKLVAAVTTVNLLGGVDRTLQFVDTDVYTLAAKVLGGGAGNIHGSIEIIDYV